jgi:hypothetical protein
MSYRIAYGRQLLQLFLNGLNTITTIAPFIPGAGVIGCASAVVSGGYSILSGGLDLMSFGSLLGNLTWNCITAIPAVGSVVAASQVIRNAVLAGQVVNGGTGIIQLVQPCHDCFYPPWKTTTWNFASSDPNEIVGPMGYDTAKKYVDLHRSLPYQVSFENKPEAARSAQTVVVTDTLSAKYNLSSLQLTNFAIGDSVFNIPPFRKEYTATVDLSKKQKVLVRFNARLILHRELYSAHLLRLIRYRNRYLPIQPLRDFCRPIQMDIQEREALVLLCSRIRSTIKILIPSQPAHQLFLIKMPLS